MASSMSTFSSLFHSLRAVAARMVAPRAPQPRMPAPPVAAAPIIVPAAARGVRAPSRRTPVQRLSRSPVRVLRVAEAGNRRATGGRVVISGRMADVCAELDRLAALEAAAP